jgi:butyrate kinase
MKKTHRIFAINVGSTSTKVAFFEDAKAVAQKTIAYSSQELTGYAELRDQLPRRRQDVMDFMQKSGIALDQLDIIISRGGLGKPGPAGAYIIDETLCEDLLAGRYGKHPSALGPAIALDMAKPSGIRAIIIDPPSTDEFEPLARVSGLPDIERKSAFHALNQKAAARKAAEKMGKSYETVNLIVAHLGGGITIGAHRRGRVIDCNHGLSEGPFTPERAGSLPTLELVELSLAAKYAPKDLQRKLVGQGGLAAYLGTTDAIAIESAIDKGDEKSTFIYQAMAYQIAKDIGAMATVLSGQVDGIVLTGGLAHSKRLAGWITARVQFLASVFLYPGEDEMAALAEGALRVLLGHEEVVRPHQ